MDFLSGNNGGLIAFMTLIGCFCWYSSHVLSTGRSCPSCGHSGLSAGTTSCPRCGASVGGKR